MIIGLVGDWQQTVSQPSLQDCGRETHIQWSVSSNITIIISLMDPHFVLSFIASEKFQTTYFAFIFMGSLDFFKRSKTL